MLRRVPVAYPLRSIGNKTQWIGIHSFRRLTFQRGKTPDPAITAQRGRDFHMRQSAFLPVHVNNEAAARAQTAD